MAEMKAQDGYQPSEEEKKKINEFATYLQEQGYDGFLMVKKGDVGVSWANIKDADEARHIIINSLCHIMKESEDAATEIAGGIILASNQITS